MDESNNKKQKVTKLDFKDLNVKPFINKKNNYQNELLNPKFAAALSKILHIKEIKWSIKHHESQTIYGQSLNALPEDSYIASFDYGEQHVGYLYFTPALCHSLIHRLLGGSDKSDNLSELDTKALSAMDKKTLASLFSPLELCLREALTPMLLLKDAKVSEGPHPRDFFLNEHDSYYFESFKVEDHKERELSLILKTKVF
jgi:hypothetical protein